jgi:putative protease
MEDAMAAAKKKPKAKVKRKKAPAGKAAIRKKSKPLKKAAAKKPAKRAAPKPAARPASKARAVPARPAPKPAAVAPARPEPLPGEELIGVVTHYYGHLSVAAIRLESGSLSVGDTIRVLGHTSDFRQRVQSMQIEHQSVTEAGKRQEIGLKVTEQARENDLVYKVTA